MARFVIESECENPRLCDTGGVHRRVLDIRELRLALRKYGIEDGLSDALDALASGEMTPIGYIPGEYAHD